MSRPVTTALQTWVAPNAADNTSVLAATTLPSSGTTVTTAGFTNPVHPRTIRFKGNQSTTQGLVLTIAGTDILGNAISETVTMGGAFATPTDTVNAFATVTSITFPTRGGASDTISVGRGAALGLDNYCSADSFGTGASVTSFTYSLTTISLNVVTLSQTLDGSTTQCCAYHPAKFVANGAGRA